MLTSSSFGLLHYFNHQFKYPAIHPGQAAELTVPAPFYFFPSHKNKIPKTALFKTLIYCYLNFYKRAIACIDNLSGFETAIASVFPKCDVQSCIVHQIRNSLKYVAAKESKAVMEDLKPIYKAYTKEEGALALDSFEEKWSKKYGIVVKSWRTNWEKLSAFFKYPPDIRKLIYTTNTIEGYHR